MTDEDRSWLTVGAADRWADEMDDAELCEVCDSPYHTTDRHDGPSDA